MEDLIEDSAEDYMKGDSGSSLGDDWFKEIEDQHNGWKDDNIDLNRRNFNIFSVLGNFPLDHMGRIINRKQLLEDMDYKDFDGRPVNNKGFLINETNGKVYSKFTWDDLCHPIDGHQARTPEDYGELPMPFRLERFNFSGHEIMGNFDFDKDKKKQIFLKNKFE